jgi:hypothetical protein
VCGGRNGTGPKEPQDSAEGKSTEIPRLVVNHMPLILTLSGNVFLNRQGQKKFSN